MRTKAIEASTWFRTAAENGHKRAAAALGELYLLNQIAPREIWSKRLAGLSRVVLNAILTHSLRLRLLMWRGTGSRQDYAVAAFWLRLAAELGSAVACFNLGSLHRYGLGVPEDHAEAARLYRLAAEKGSTDAPFQLGLLVIRMSQVRFTMIPPPQRRLRKLPMRATLCPATISHCC